MESWRRKDRGGRKSPAPGGIQTLDLMITRRVLYRCATTASFNSNHDLILSRFICAKPKANSTYKSEDILNEDWRGQITTKPTLPEASGHCNVKLVEGVSAIKSKCFT